MYRFLGGVVEIPDKILIYLLRHERNVRRGYLRQSDENVVKRRISRYLIVRHIATPISFSRTSDVPVRKIVGKVLYSSCALRYLVLVKTFVNKVYERIESRKYPFIHERELCVLERILRRIEFVYIRV